jgi:hypothetical protein
MPDYPNKKHILFLQIYHPNSPDSWHVNLSYKTFSTEENAISSKMAVLSNETLFIPNSEITMTRPFLVQSNKVIDTNLRWYN